MSDPEPFYAGALRCANPACKHARDIHTPTGRMDDTKVRGEGKCTAGPQGRPCPCEQYEERKR